MLNPHPAPLCRTTPRPVAGLSCCRAAVPGARAGAGRSRGPATSACANATAARRLA